MVLKSRSRWCMRQMLVRPLEGAQGGWAEEEEEEEEDGAGALPGQSASRAYLLESVSRRVGARG